MSDSPPPPTSSSSPSPSPSPSSARSKKTLGEKVEDAFSTAPSPKPNAKEFHESMAFFKTVSSTLQRKKKAKYDWVLDVCGGHGLIGMLFLIYSRASNLMVLDRIRPQSFDSLLAGFELEQALESGSIVFEQGDLRDVLSSTLDSLTESGSVLVVACHACGYLSDLIMDMACVDRTLDIAIAPCCHSKGSSHADQTRNQERISPYASARKACASAVHASASNIPGLAFPVALDFARMGRIDGLGTYAYVSIKTIDPDITPENRILIALT